MSRDILPCVERIERDIMQLAEITDDNSSGYTRVSFSDEDLRARDYLRQLMERDADLKVCIDEAGNLIGKKEGTVDGASIMIGSHIDTVQGGGRFDGIAGVVAGLEILRRFKEENIVTTNPIELVVFLAEEASPFGISTIGSRGMTGKLTPDQLYSLTNNEGHTLASAITKMGGNPERISDAKRTSQSIKSYVELHIEQGLNLASQGIDIGIVTGLTGIYKGVADIVGRPDHAGTTPMNARKDALVAAADAVLIFESICKTKQEVVGTIGKMKVHPNAGNVIPGFVKLDYDLRSPNTSTMIKIVNEYKGKLDTISTDRDVNIKCDFYESSAPVFFNINLIEKLKVICSDIGMPYLEMFSMAGHDAEHLAEIVPSCMLFIPSKDGRSHCPEEWSDFKDIGYGARIMTDFVMSF